MQIDIDFFVFQALTALRESESDSYNAVILRLLRLVETHEQSLAALTLQAPYGVAPPPDETEIVVDDKIAAPQLISKNMRTTSELIAGYLAGAWIGRVHFPEGSKFRATYKGASHFAEIRNNKWVGQDGVERNSPSEAASAITGNNVNGWRFWYVQRPGDPGWRKLEDLKP